MLTQDEIRLGVAVSSEILEEDVPGKLVTSPLPTPLEKKKSESSNNPASHWNMFRCYRGFSLSSAA